MIEIEKLLQILKHRLEIVQKAKGELKAESVVLFNQGQQYELIELMRIIKENSYKHTNNKTT